MDTRVLVVKIVNCSSTLLMLAASSPVASHTDFNFPEFPQYLDKAPLIPFAFLFDGRVHGNGRKFVRI